MSACVCGEARCPGDGGRYYVSVIDGERYAFLLGPYATHAEALDQVDRGTRLAYDADPRAPWYAYGTARVPDDAGPEPTTLFGR